MNFKQIATTALIVAGLAAAYSTVKHIDRQIGALSDRVTADSASLSKRITSEAAALTDNVVAQHRATSVAMLQLRDDFDHLADQWAAASPADGGHNHTETRVFMIRSKIAQAGHPVVFMGDSITEAARLPATLCGHDVVNAGIGGASSTSYRSVVGRILPENEKLPLIFVALGTNDSQKLSRPSSSFRASYTALIDILALRADNLVLVGTPPMEASKPLAESYFDPAKATDNDAIIREIATQRGIPFIDLRAQMIASNITIDGIHFNAGGYKLWDAAVLSKACSAYDSVVQNGSDSMKRPLKSR